jgi:hypothetical protein
MAFVLTRSYEIYFVFSISPTNGTDGYVVHELTRRTDMIHGRLRRWIWCQLSGVSGTWSDYSTHPFETI